MAKVWLRKDRMPHVWVADFRDATGRRVRKMAVTREEAEALLGRHLVEARHFKPAVADRDITFAQYAARFEQTAARDLESRTLRSYQHLLTRHLTPVLGHMKLREIRRSHVKALLRGKGDVGYSRNTQRLIRAVLSTILSEAVDDELVPANVMFQLGRKTLGQAQGRARPDITPMTRAQLTEFLDGLQTLEEEGRLGSGHALLFELMVKTGLRYSEATALRLGDIDLTEGRLHVERALDTHGRVKGTKTNEARHVDLSAGLLNRMATFLALREAEAVAQAVSTNESQDIPQQAPSPWLFSTPEGHPLEEAKTRKIFHATLAKIGLPTFRLYDLRHTFASMLLSNGVPLTYVAKQLGHHKPDTTLRYYSHWIPDAGENFMDRLDLGTDGTQVGTTRNNEAPTEECSGSQAPEMIDEKWSRRSGLNRRPADYEGESAPKKDEPKDE